MGIINVHTQTQTASSPLLSLRLPQFCYQNTPVLTHVSLDIYPKDLCAIVGANGSGKTTLLKILAGILSPGADATLSRNIPYPGYLAYLPQIRDIDRTFPLRAEDVVAMGLWPRYGEHRAIPKQDHPAVIEALQQVGLEAFRTYPLHHLSGGQLQRLFFARLIVQDAMVILLDEPFNAVDQKTTHLLSDLMLKWHQQGKTILVVLHNLDMVRHLFPQTILMAQTIIAQGATDDVLTADNLEKALHYV